MTDENQVQEAEPVVEERPKPGRRLREAREAKGLTQQEVASQLRLQLRLIEALEEDDEAALPPATFVQGYLRSYARLLELPEESLLPPSNTEVQPPLVSTIANKGEASSRDWPARLVTYLVIAAIAVSVAMWWISQRSDNVIPMTQHEPEVVSQGDSMNLSLPEKPSSAPQAEEETPAETQGDSATTAADAGSNESTEVEQTTVKEAEPAPAQAEEKTATDKVPPLTGATPQSTLKLSYQSDSWTEVSDSAGRQLAYGLIKAGQVLELKGEAPFRVFLGYAPGVNVYYNGELFDHSPFQRRDVARFRVGRAEHNHPASR